MKTEYTFTITIEIESAKAEMLYGENWLEAYKESAAEFGEEAQAFFEAHPFVAACKKTERTEA